MTAVLVPLSATPAQTISVQLGTQSCSISVYQKATGLFCDLSVSGTLIIAGVLVHNACKIVRDAYLGFAGDLVFYDTQGNSDPTYDGLGARYILTYQS
jgi:hypothetical protein